MKNQNIKIFVLLIAVILIFVFVVQGNKEVPVENQQVNSIQTSNTIAGVKIGGKIVEVEVVQTPLEMSRGLSGRAGLGENQGMLFVFDQPGRYSFWMKDMNFPIDMIWLGENLRVVYMKERAHPESFPESFSPDAEAQYVLEVMAGFAEKYNLKEGDKVEFIYK